MTADAANLIDRHSPRQRAVSSFQLVSTIYFEVGLNAMCVPEVGRWVSLLALEDLSEILHVFQ
jgi:hypothetical protein